MKPQYTETNLFQPRSVSLDRSLVIKSQLSDTGPSFSETGLAAPACGRPTYIDYRLQP